MLLASSNPEQVTYNDNVDEPLKSSIRIRIPSWAAKKMAIVVNGKKIVSGNPGTYVTIDRQWKNGDAISFTLPMNFSLTKYIGAESDAKHEHYALEYGPILMAYASMKGEAENIMLPVSSAELIKSLNPVAGKPLHFTINGNSNFEYMPYLEVQNESFTCFP